MIFNLHPVKIGRLKKIQTVRDSVRPSIMLNGFRHSQTELIVCGETKALEDGYLGLTQQDFLLP